MPDQNESERVLEELREKIGQYIAEPGKHPWPVAFSTEIVVNQASAWKKRAKADGSKSYYGKYLESVIRSGKFEAIDQFFRGILEGGLSRRNIAYLDIGCAEGLRTEQFMNMLNEFSSVDYLMATDIMPEFVKRAGARLGRNNVAVDDVTTMSHSPYFDIITCLFGVLGHVPYEKMPDAFSNMNMALRERGFVCFDVLKEVNESHEKPYIIYPPHDGTGRFIKNADGIVAIGSARMYTPGELEKLAADAGFRPEIKEIAFKNQMTDYAVVLHKE